jgi:hypothetical protein
MPTRPILGQDSSPAGVAPSPSSGPAQEAQPNSPLASQLPIWDLVPPHTLLVRRRPVLASRPSSPPTSAVEPPHAPPQSDFDETHAYLQGLAQRAAVAPSPSDNICQKCGAQLEQGSRFCTECGTKQG